MKLRKAQLFYILLLCLLLGSLGFSIKESFSIREGLTSGTQTQGQRDELKRWKQNTGGRGAASPRSEQHSDTRQRPARRSGQSSQRDDGGGAGDGEHAISKSQINPGNEDLYVLKSSIVPPVCPKCPDINLSECYKKKCPPCPPCARCPEQAFKCKKVPDYTSKNTSYLPQPVLTDFSKFSV